MESELLVKPTPLQQAEGWLRAFAHVDSRAKIMGTGMWIDGTSVLLVSDELLSELPELANRVHEIAHDYPLLIELLKECREDYFSFNTVDWPKASRLKLAKIDALLAAVTGTPAEQDRVAAERTNQ